jgi:hypothetical protein
MGFTVNHDFLSWRGRALTNDIMAPPPLPLLSSTISSLPQKSFLNLNRKPRRRRLTLKGFYHPNAGKITLAPEKMTLWPDPWVGV